MKIGDYQTHPAANVFALLKGADFDALVEDIRKNGLHEPIWLVAGKDKRKQLILDGRNRLRACLKAKVTPRFRTYTGDSPMAFVWSLNAARRHLDKSQESLAAAKALPHFKAEAKARQRAAGGDKKSAKAGSVPAKLPEPIGAGDARDAAAGPNVSGRSVQHAATVLEQAVPAIIELVEDDLRVMPPTLVIASYGLEA